MEVVEVPEVTLEQAKKVFDVVGHGLTCGIGKPDLGKMCVEAAVCYALGLPHSDDPPCVAEAVRIYKITLNDSAWETDMIRAKAFEKIAICQLGSNKIDQVEFFKYVAFRIIKEILPIVLDKAHLHQEAWQCRGLVKIQDAFELIETMRDGIENQIGDGDLGGNFEEEAVDVLSSVVGALRGRLEERKIPCSVDDITNAISHAPYIIGSSALEAGIQIGIDALTACGSPGVELWNQLEAEGYTKRAA